MEQYQKDLEGPRATVYNLYADELKLEKWKILDPLDAKWLRYIYFVQSEADPHLIKIGKSSNIQRRLAGLRSTSPVPIKPVGLLIAPDWMELRLHDLFDEYRAHGEWFEPGERLIGFLAAEKGGDYRFTKERALQRFEAFGSSEELLVRVYKAFKALERQFRYEEVR